MTDPKARPALVLRTLVAIVLAAIVFLVVATLVAIVVDYSNDFLRGTMPRIIHLIGKAFGAVVGVIAAKKACDAVLIDYSGKAVCVVFELFSGVFLILVAFHWREIDWQVFKDIVQSLVLAFAALLFWETDGKKLQLNLF